MSVWEKAIAAAKIAALVSVTVLCILLGVLVVQVQHSLSSIQTTIQPIAQKITLDLDEIHRLTLEAGLTAMEARKASAEERKALPTLTAQAQQSLQDMDALLVAARKTTDGVGASQAQIAQSTVTAMATVNDTIRNVQPVLDQTQLAIAALRPIEAGVDRQVNDPAVTEILHHLDSTMSAVDTSAQDVQREIHALTHPTWLHRMYGWALDAVKVLNPL